LLLALAAVQRSERWLSFTDVEPQLKRLLADFGPDRRSIHPEYPFWRLRNDGLWDIQDEAALKDTLTSSGDVPSTVLRNGGAKAGFTDPFFATLRSRPNLLNSAAEILLEQCFPESLHETILDAVDFQWVVIARGRRDPQFRVEILRIYDHRCAVCGFDARLGNTDLGLEAAHIKWHAAGGPDTSNNGMALCSFHHLAFDRGALSIDERRRILISKDVHGQNHIDQLLLAYGGEPLRMPQRGEPTPENKYLDWHRREVFWAPARSFGAKRIV
jgi:putative restriction endonuclease